MDQSFQVQIPAAGPFDASALMWTIKIDPTRLYHTISYAHIPWERVSDFISGESKVQSTPTNFKIRSSRKNQHGSISNPNEQSWSELYCYWCTYGPKDMRNTLEASQPLHPKRPNVKSEKHFVGCRCHFYVYKLYLWPTIARINYIEQKHVDLDGNICHGEEVSDSRLTVAPWLSNDVRTWVTNLLHKGFTPQQVFQQHIVCVESQVVSNPNKKLGRDAFLTMRDILNIATKLESVTYQTDKSDTISVHNWVLENGKQTFIYQQMGEDVSQPFILGIQTEWQLQMLNKYGNNNILAMDATFGTNVYKFTLYSILVFDAHRNGVPIAWIITSCVDSTCAKVWLMAFRNRILDFNRSWEANAWMIDDAQAEINALQKIFGLPIYLCIWHVRRCWLKHLIKKVIDPQTRASMFRDLGYIMNMRCRDLSTEARRLEEASTLVENFLTKYSAQEKFISYFQEHWIPKIGMWIRATRTLNHANQDTNGSIEAYHGVLKNRFLCGRRSIHGRRVDWLLHKLLTACHPYYWYNEAMKEAGFRQNFTIQKIVLSSLERARNIPDHYVKIMDDDHSIAKVKSMSNTKLWYTVHNADCEWANCNCDWAMKGNLCKHQMKVMMIVNIDVHTIVTKSMDMYRNNIEGNYVRTFISMPNHVASMDNDMIEEEEIHLSVHNVDISQTHGNTMQIVHDRFQEAMLLAEREPALQPHLERLQTQLLATLKQIKGSLKETGAHPCKEWAPIDDGFGNSLKRAKPFVEKMLSTTRRQPHSSDVHDFPIPTKKKKVSMQGRLDNEASRHEGAANK